MAIAWVAARSARDLGARRRQQRASSSRRTWARCDQLDFSAEELADIDRYAIEADINQWADSSAAD